MDPVYSSEKFYEHLAEVPGYSRLPLTVAAQRVQKSGFPQAYAKHERDASLLAAALTGRAATTLTCGGATEEPGDEKELRAALARDFGKDVLPATGAAYPARTRTARRTARAPSSSPSPRRRASAGAGSWPTGRWPTPPGSASRRSPTRAAPGAPGATGRPRRRRPGAAARARCGSWSPRAEPEGPSPHALGHLPGRRRGGPAGPGAGGAEADPLPRAGGRVAGAVLGLSRPTRRPGWCGAFPNARRWCVTCRGEGGAWLSVRWVSGRRLEARRLRRRRRRAAPVAAARPCEGSPGRWRVRAGAPGVRGVPEAGVAGGGTPSSEAAESIRLMSRWAACRGGRQCDALSIRDPAVPQPSPLWRGSHGVAGPGSPARTARRPPHRPAPHVPPEGATCPSPEPPDRPCRPAGRRRGRPRGRCGRLRPTPPSCPSGRPCPG